LDPFREGEVTKRQPPTTVLGFDFGLSRIGIAIGQTLTASARPIATLRSRDGKPDWAAIGALIEQWQPQAFVVGHPFNMDDTEVDWAPRIHRFARQLEGRFERPVHLVDERLTSIEARRQLAERPGRRRFDRESVDAVAAALIIETWLTEQTQP
jgi:putative Holliday junction resolvase